MRPLLAPVLRAGGAGGAVAGCAAMTAMLPGTAASALGVLGLGGSSVVGRVLSSVAEPLFVVSAVLLIAGGLACGWMATALAGIGGLLLYTSMFMLTTEAAPGSAMPDMGGMGGAQANALLFWSGAALIVGSLVVPWRRRKRGTCSPVFRMLVH